MAANPSWETLHAKYKFKQCSGAYNVLMLTGVYGNSLFVCVCVYTYICKYTYIPTHTHERGSKSQEVT